MSCFQQMRSLRTSYQSFLYITRVKKFVFELRKLRKREPVALASRVKKRNNFSPSTARENYSTSKRSAVPLASQPLSNALRRSTWQRRRPESDDLTPRVATLVKTSKRARLSNYRVRATTRHCETYGRA